MSYQPQLASRSFFHQPYLSNTLVIQHLVEEVISIFVDDFKKLRLQLLKVNGRSASGGSAPWDSWNSKPIALTTSWCNHRLTFKRHTFEIETSCLSQRLTHLRTQITVSLCEYPDIMVHHPLTVGKVMQTTRLCACSKKKCVQTQHPEMLQISWIVNIYIYIHIIRIYIYIRIYKLIYTLFTARFEQA